MKASGKIAYFLGKILEAVFKLWTTPVFRVGIRDAGLQFDLFPGLERSGNIDERIAQIDQAKDNLTAALSAIVELKESAEQNKLELHDALERIKAAREDKESAEKELENVRQIAQADIGVFRKLARIPSRLDIWRERGVGFVVGVLSSLLASLIWWLFAR